MNYHGNNQCDICVGSGNCEYCGGKNYDEMITADRLLNAFYDTAKKGKLYKLTYNKILQSLIIEEDWLAFGESIDCANCFKIESDTNLPFNFLGKSYREIIGETLILMATHVMVEGDNFVRLVTCRKATTC
jgi:hypothetical protein